MLASAVVASWSLQDHVEQVAPHHVAREEGAIEDPPRPPQRASGEVRSLESPRLVDLAEEVIKLLRDDLCFVEVEARPLGVDHRLHARREDTAVHRLRQVVVGARLERLLDVGFVARGGEQDDADVAEPPIFPDLTEEHRRVHHRHHVIEQDHVRHLRRQEAERLVRALRGMHDVAGVLEHRAVEAEHRRRVVHDEH